MSDLSLTRGDTGLYNLAITRNGAAFDLTGCTVFFTAKSSPALADADAELAYDSSTANITIAAGTGGLCELRLDKADTDLMWAGNYVYDVQVKDTNGYIFTPIIGSLEIVMDTTRRTA